MDKISGVDNTAGKIKLIRNCGRGKRKGIDFEKRNKTGRDGMEGFEEFAGYVGRRYLEL